MTRALQASLFLLFVGKEQTNMRSSNLNPQKIFVQILIDQPNKACGWKSSLHLHFIFPLMAGQHYVHNKRNTFAFMPLFLHRHIRAALPWLIAHQFHSGLPCILIICPCHILQIHQHIWWRLRGVTEFCCCQRLLAVGGLCTVITVIVRGEGRVVCPWGFRSRNGRIRERKCITTTSSQGNTDNRSFSLSISVSIGKWGRHTSTEKCPSVKYHKMKQDILYQNCTVLPTVY